MKERKTGENRMKWSNEAELVTEWNKKRNAESKRQIKTESYNSVAYIMRHTFLACDLDFKYKVDVGLSTRVEMKPIGNGKLFSIFGFRHERILLYFWDQMEDTTTGNPVYT
jgi:hypothetical protein